MLSSAEGLNKSVGNYNDMDKKCTDLIHEELTKYDLGLAVVDGHVALITTVPKKEGDLICPCSALHFDNMAGLLSVVNTDKVNLAKNPVLRTDSVGLTEDRSSSVWSLLIGAASHIAPVGKSAKRANAAFNFDITQGACDGLITLVVKTRNGCGIAAKSVVSVDLGPDYDPPPGCNIQVAVVSSPLLAAALFSTPERSQATAVELAASKKQFMDKWFQDTNEATAVPVSSKAETTSQEPANKKPRTSDTKAKPKPAPVPPPVKPTPAPAATGPEPVAGDKPAPSVATETLPVQADATSSEAEPNSASVATFIVNDAMFRLDFKNLKIYLPVGTITNKRLAPGTIVYTLDCSAGRFRKNSSAVGLEFKLTSAKEKVVVNGKQTTVAEAVSTLKSTSIWEHTPASFTEGSLPSVGLKPNNQMVWIPSDEAAVATEPQMLF